MSDLEILEAIATFGFFPNDFKIRVNELSTHKGLKDAALADYLRTYFSRTLAYFKVNKVGRIGFEVMPKFIHLLTSD